MGVQRNQHTCPHGTSGLNALNVPNVEFKPYFVPMPLMTRNVDDPRDLDVFNQQYLADQDLKRIQDGANLRRATKNYSTEHRLLRGTSGLATERKSVAGDWGRAFIPSSRMPVVNQWVPRSTRFDSVQTL